MEIEDLSKRKRLLYEIEQILDMEENGLQLQSVRRQTGNCKIPNRDIYKILKAVNQCRDVKPQIVYTGKEVLKREEAEEMEENIPQLEPSM